MFQASFIKFCSVEPITFLILFGPLTGVVLAVLSQITNIGSPSLFLFAGLGTGTTACLIILAKWARVLQLLHRGVMIPGHVTCTRQSPLPVITYTEIDYTYQIGEDNYSKRVFVNLSSDDISFLRPTVIYDPANPNINIIPALYCQHISIETNTEPESSDAIRSTSIGCIVRQRQVQRGLRPNPKKSHHEPQISQFNPRNSNS